MSRRAARPATVDLTDATRLFNAVPVKAHRPDIPPPAEALALAHRFAADLIKAGGDLIAAFENPLGHAHMQLLYRVDDVLGAWWGRLNTLKLASRQVHYGVVFESWDGQTPAACPGQVRGVTCGCIVEKGHRLCHLCRRDHEESGRAVMQ